MWSVAQPLFLWGLLTLAIPILLHLRRRRPGPVIDVGDASLFAQDEPSRGRGLQWDERLLLLLRCLLLVVLVLLLAGLRKAHPSSSEPQRWLLVDPALARLAPQALPDAIAPWQEAGFRVRTLAPGSPTWPSPSTYRGDPWSLVGEAAMDMNPGSQLTVLTTVDPQRLRGPRPTLPIDVTWQVIPPADDHRWLQRITTNPDGTSQQVIGHSNATTLYYQQEPVPANHAAQANATTIAVALQHSDDRRDDARYVRAVLETATAIAGYQLTWTQPDEADLFIWINQDPLPPIKAKPRIILSDAVGTLKSTPGNHIKTAVGTEIAIYQRGEASGLGRAIIWDAYGEPLLEQDENHYRFHTRFNPSATAWVRADDFPNGWLEFLNRYFAPSTDFEDRRSLPTPILTTHYAAGKTTVDETAYAGMHMPLLWACLLLLALERWWSERRVP